MPSFKVYISSTYIDLIDYRKAVRDFFSKFRDKFEVISMEDYVADSELPADKCVEDVKRCDFYILILANRYGFIPDSSDKFKNPAGLSVTHAEYAAARDNNKKVFAFFADSTAGFESDNDADPELRKSKAEKLKALKEEVRIKYLTHPENFNSVFQLALMVSESMMKASEKYIDLLPRGGQQFIDRYINQDRIEFLDRTPQFNQYLYSMRENKAPFKPIIIYGEKDSLVVSLQKRITNIILNIPKSKIYTETFNSIFGTGSEYEEIRPVFLNAVFKQMFGSEEITSPPKDFKELAFFLNTKQEESHIAIVINWGQLVNKGTDPRVNNLAKMLKEIYDACSETGCQKIFFFINISYKPEAEKAFTDIIDGLRKPGSKETQFLIALPKLSYVNNGDLELWIENYVTDEDFKINKIISEYMADLDDEFSMQKAQEKISEFINSVNNKDPKVLQILN